MMQIRRFVDPQLFLEHCRDWLLRDELKNSTMLAVMQLLIEDDNPFESPIYLATIETDAGIAGCAVRASPDPLILSDMPVEAMPMLAADVATVYEELPVVAGMESEADAFTEHWIRQGKSQSATKTHWRWYVLERPAPTGKSVPGALRLAGFSDIQLVRKWAQHFARETGTSVDVVAYFERRIQSGSLYIWESEERCSIVAVSGVTPNSVRISGVFTAPDFRRKGYATATVAAVSRLMLDAGRKYCLLFTEASDPFANRLYRNVGYKPMFDKVSICLSD
jgi:predicted GNAT family acetyltransferase